MYRPLAVLCLLSLSACAAGPQYFTPGEHVRGTRADGHREALYQLQGKDSRFGEARVWSRGSIVSMVDGAERTVVHVGFELNNTGAQPLSLVREALKLEVVHTDAGPLENLTPHSASTLTVAPQTIGQGQAVFVLPPEIEPRDVRSFRLHWAVAAGQQRYQNNTPFVERRDRYYDHHHHGYVMYDVHHPDYWHYRHLGYCYDIACRYVVVVPHRYPAPPRRQAPVRRTRVRP
jgi:hypothetical protein